MAMSKSDLISKLNVVKFLMCMAHSPTSRFSEDDEMASVGPEVEEIKDWGAFLREGVERWSPHHDSESSVSVLFVCVVFLFGVRVCVSGDCG